ncbi:MAG: helicase [Deltaproteobacteria bacterium]|nr:helicase [Deltaproteobacteria bacterium]
MPRVNSFEVEITTGAQGMPGPVKFDFNGHTMEFQQPEGGTAAGEKFRGVFPARSFAHSVALVGPPEGKWKIDELRITYHCDNSEPYAVTFTDFELDDSVALDIWRPAPLPTFDV